MKNILIYIFVTYITFFVINIDVCSCENEICGDANGDGNVNMIDSLIVRNYYMYGFPVNCINCSDVNGDGNVNLLDSLLIRNYYMYGFPLNCTF